MREKGIGMRRAIDDLTLELQILSRLAASDAPIGATALALELGAAINLSQASIGRKLMELDARGLTRQERNRGRRLTESGDRRRRELELAVQQAQENSNLLGALRVTDLTTLLDVLVARRALERETAGLAAAHATGEDLTALQASIAIQERILASGSTPQEEDHRFHDLIAVASGNPVLLHALHLVRTESLYDRHVAVMRQRVGGRLIDDHRLIVDCIRSGSIQAASDAMDHHINKLIADVRAYFALHDAGTDGSAGLGPAGGAQPAAKKARSRSRRTDRVPPPAVGRGHGDR